MNILICKWHKEIVQSFLNLNANIILILDNYDLEFETIDENLLKKIQHLYTISEFDSIDELSAIITDLKLKNVPIQKIVSLTEYSQYGTGFLAEILKIPNYSLEQALSTRDKRMMKFLADKNGIATANFFSISNFKDLNQRKKAALRVGFPMVIKPVNGLGTMTTVKINSLQEMNLFLDQINFEPCIHSKHLIAEKFISGQEYHIDALWSEDEPIIFTVSRYHAPRLELLNSAKANGSITLSQNDYPELYETCLTFNKTLNRVLGITSGPTHLEFFKKESHNELVFSELASRFGGAAVPETLQALYGVNPFKIWVSQVMGKPIPKLHKRNDENNYIGWLNIAPAKSGTITHFPDEQTLKSFEGILNYECVKKLGDNINISHPSVWCLLLVLGAKSEKEYEKLVHKVLSEFVIETK